MPLLMLGSGRGVSEERVAGGRLKEPKLWQWVAKRNSLVSDEPAGV